MEWYLLHLRGGGEATIDEDGMEFASLDALRATMLRRARDIIAGDVGGGTIDLRHRIDAEDAGGRSSPRCRSPMPSR